MRCAVNGCNNSNTSSKKYEYKSGMKRRLSFFTFPKDKVLAECWKTFCRRKDSPITINSRICSAHFDDNDFESNFHNEIWVHSKKLRKLKEGRVPTILSASCCDNFAANIAESVRKNKVTSTATGVKPSTSADTIGRSYDTRKKATLKVSESAKMVEETCEGSSVDSTIAENDIEHVFLIADDEGQEDLTDSELVENTEISPAPFETLQAKSMPENAANSTPDKCNKKTEIQFVDVSTLTKPKMSHEAVKQKPNPGTMPQLKEIPVLKIVDIKTIMSKISTKKAIDNDEKRVPIVIDSSSDEEKDLPSTNTSNIVSFRTEMKRSVTPPLCLIPKRAYTRIRHPNKLTENIQKPALLLVPKIEEEVEREITIDELNIAPKENTLLNCSFNFTPEWDEDSCSAINNEPESTKTNQTQVVKTHAVMDVIKSTPLIKCLVQKKKETNKSIEMTNVIDINAITNDETDDEEPGEITELYIFSDQYISKNTRELSTRQRETFENSFNMPFRYNKQIPFRNETFCTEYSFSKITRLQDAKTFFKYCTNWKGYELERNQAITRFVFRCKGADNRNDNPQCKESIFINYCPPSIIIEMYKTSLYHEHDVIQGCKIETEVRKMFFEFAYPEKDIETCLLLGGCSSTAPEIQMLIRNIVMTLDMDEINSVANSNSLTSVLLRLDKLGFDMKNITLYIKGMYRELISEIPQIIVKFPNFNKCDKKYKYWREVYRAKLCQKSDCPYLSGEHLRPNYWLRVASYSSIIEVQDFMELQNMSWVFSHDLETISGFEHYYHCILKEQVYVKCSLCLSFDGLRNEIKLFKTRETVHDHREKYKVLPVPAQNNTVNYVIGDKTTSNVNYMGQPFTVRKLESMLAVKPIEKSGTIAPENSKVVIRVIPRVKVKQPKFRYILPKITKPPYVSHQQFIEDEDAILDAISPAAIYSIQNENHENNYNKVQPSSVIRIDDDEDNCNPAANIVSTSKTDYEILETCKKLYSTASTDLNPVISQSTMLDVSEIKIEDEIMIED